MAVVVVDSRVGSRELLPLFPRGIAELGTLSFGDLAFWGQGPEGVPAHIGIERKRIDDLLASYASGRLAGVQLPGLVNGYTRAYLVVEGVWGADEWGQLVIYGKGGRNHGHVGKRVFAYREVANFLHTLTEVLEVRVVQTASPRATVDWVMATYHWWADKAYEAHGSHRRFHEPDAPLLRESVGVQVASRLPGIGWEKAHKVMDHFGSIHAMATAAVGEWTLITGIGDTIARRVHAEIHRDGRQTTPPREGG